MLKLKRLVALAAAGVLACSMIVLAGCSGSNPEDTVREDITNRLEKLKVHDADTLDELMSLEGYYEPWQFDNYDIDMEEFLPTYLDGFDYTVDEVTTTDESIKVTATITYKTYPNYESACNAAMDAVWNDESLIDASNEEFDARMHDAAVAALDETVTVTTEPFTFYYKKANDSYMPMFSVLYEVTEAAFE